MLDAKVTYFFVDPVGKVDSGISSYIRNALNFMVKLGISVEILSRNDGEDIETFRRRVGDYFQCKDLTNCIIEVPETYAASKYIKLDAKIHIRLHFSRVLGAFLESKPVPKIYLKEEQAELDRAYAVSSPSNVGLDLARLFFDIKKCVIFCNPISVCDFEKSVKKIDVGFVGRWQSLKGIEYLEKIIANRSDLTFCIASCDQAEKKMSKYANVVFYKSHEANLVYRLSKVIFIPSLFETASMVALEAICNGLPVISWSHIGVCEYVKKPVVYEVPFLDFKALDKVIDECLSCENEMDFFNKSVLAINESFVAGVNKIIEGEYKNNSLVRSDVKFDKFFFEGLKVLTKNAELTSTQRKWRKFRRMPIRFFVDVYKKKMGYLVVPEVKPASVNDERSVLKKRNKKQKNRRRINIFCNIKNWNDISFHDFGQKNSGYRTVFLFDRLLYESLTYRDLLERVYSHNDFSPMKRGELSRGYARFDTFPSCDNPGILLDSISLKQRNHVGSVRNIFVFDCFEPGFFELLRSFNPFLNVIAVYTGIVNDDFLLNRRLNSSVDCFIGTLGQSFNSVFRKNYVFNDIKYLDIVIRKVIQESLDKKPDYLLNLYGEDEYRSDLEEFKIDVWDGLIFVENFNGFSNDNDDFDSFINSIIANIKIFYVKESIYLKYKTICDDILEKDYLACFLKYSLKDGAIYDVKEL